ncbi:GAF domain-containing protein [Chloroflexota bacterium]
MSKSDLIYSRVAGRLHAVVRSGLAAFLLVFSKGSLRTKIITWSFVPTAIILIAVALVTYYAYQQVTEKLVIERDQELTRLSAGQLAAGLVEYTDRLTALARTAGIYQNDPAAQRDTLKGAGNRLAIFDGGVLILDTFGTVVAVEPKRPEVLGQDWSNRAYYREIVRSQIRGSPRPVFSDIIVDGPGGAEVIVVAVPITGEQGEFVGTMVGMFRLGTTGVSTFYGGIVKLRLGESGNTYLVDGNGRVIYHSDTDYIGEDFSTQAVVQQVLNGQVGAIRTSDLHGHDIVAGFAPVPGMPWGLVTEESWTALTSGSRGYGRFLLLLLALGVVVPVVVVTIGVRRIMQPIEALISAAKEVARGNFGQSITAQTGDEIEELAGQFNLMSAQLQESYANLEQRVADRTRELAILNAIGASVNESLDLYQTLDRILDETLALLDLEVGEIRLLDEESDELVIRTERGLSVEYVRQANRQKVADKLPEHSISTGEPVIEKNLLADSQYPLAQQEGLRALAIFPLRAKEKLMGTLCLATRHGPRSFTRNERELLRAVSDQAAVAIENSSLYAESSRRVDEIETLFSVGQAITSRLDRNAVLQLIADEARRLTSSRRAFVFLCEDDTLCLSVLSGEDFAGISTGFQMSIADSLTGLAVQSGQPVRISDARQDPRANTELVQRLEVQSLLIVPLTSSTESIGSISVINKETGTFGPDNERVLTMLASVAVIAIENARLYEQAQQLAAAEERNRLARELHDSATQSLYGVTMFAEAAARLLKSGQTEMATEHMREVRTTAREALQEMRLLIFELRPPILEEHGLAAALQTRLESVEGRSGLQTEFQAEGISDLPSEIEEGLYRIAQESLNNALKHAQARRVSIGLTQEQRSVVLEIADDGIGFDPNTAWAKGGLGLRGMEERVALLGGQLAVNSKPGEGTKVRVEVEVPPIPDANYD